MHRSLTILVICSLQSISKWITPVFQLPCGDAVEGSLVLWELGSPNSKAKTAPENLFSLLSLMDLLLNFVLIACVKYDTEYMSIEFLLNGHVGLSYNCVLIQHKESIGHGHWGSLSPLWYIETSYNWYNCVLVLSFLV